MELSASDAKLELILLEARAESFEGADFDASFINAGLAPEIVLRLRQLWEATCEIGDKVVRIGKVVLAELARFTHENPHLAIGVALGAGVGALVSMVPFLGPFLAPLALVLGVVVGAVGGSRLDRNEVPGEGVVGGAQEAIIIARKFFELFAAIFAAVAAELNSGS